MKLVYPPNGGLHLRILLWSPALAGLFAIAVSAQSLTYSRGQNVSPAYEGWEGVDIIAHPPGCREKKLLVADMDSTMIGQECIDELADFAGLKPKIAAITERAMRGEIDNLTGVNDPYEEPEDADLVLGHELQCTSCVRDGLDAELGL